MLDPEIREGLTFDDVLLLPAHSKTCLLYTSDAADDSVLV